MDRPFWESTYRDDTVTTFGIKPNRTIEAMWEIFDKNWERNDDRFRI